MSQTLLHTDTVELVLPQTTRRSELDKNEQAAVFDYQLQEAMHAALTGEIALVVVPHNYPKSAVLTTLVQLVPEDRAYQIRTPGNELHFEGAQGSVRLYSDDWALYDRKLKRVRGYPPGLKTFVHPAVAEV